jgi:CRP-like cAMP-binding protein
MPQNHLLELLPRSARLALFGDCETVQLVRGEVLAEPGTPTRHAYFPVDGFISLITHLDGKPTLEVGMVGREGMVGVQLLLGVPTAPLHALVQGSGSALRIGAASLRRNLRDSGALQGIAGRYIYVLMAQFAASAACIRYHDIDQRLARWLLMTRDCAHANQFPVTHEFLAYMLGVRRVGITTAASALQRRHLIEYHRGALTVLDPAGLRLAACACYADNRRSYDRLLA